MCSQGVEGGNVCKAQLAEGILQDRNTSLGRSGRVGGCIYGLDDFINLGRNKRVYGAGQRWPFGFGSV